FRYRVDLPPGISGATVFRMVAAAGELAAFADLPVPAAGTAQGDGVATGAAAAGVSAAASAAPGSTPLAREPPLDRLSSAISANEPVYLAFGNRYRRNARFQISFKYRFFNENGGLARDLPGLQGGLEHESNGREGLSSRSINTAFVRPTVKIGDPEAWHLTLGPKVYAYLDRTGNPDIALYRGHADLFASVGHPETWQFAATVRRGTGNAFGSSLLEATYPLRQVSLGNLDGYFYFQYFNGYGESILDYNRRLPAQLRVGFSITRWL
ncbi:MAG: phospholipase A, partial [Proteobacteria bacterium]|nr:phospholipase A [Pseudomonadota bacterium]